MQEQFLYNFDHFLQFYILKWFEYFSFPSKKKFERVQINDDNVIHSNFTFKNDGY